MAYRAAWLLPLLAGTLAAQYGTAPKASPQDYPAHAELRNLAIGAEYLVHSFSRGREMYIATDYLVVEVALFPAKDQSFLVNAGAFSLRLNGRKQTLAPQAAEVVANQLKYPDPNSHLHGVEQVGPVVIGQPQSTERFPGDPNVIHRPPVSRPDDGPTSADKDPPVTAEDLVVQTALPEGDHRAATSGFLYFPYRGKISRIHSLELIVNLPEGSATLQLPIE